MGIQRPYGRGKGYTKELTVDEIIINEKATYPTTAAPLAKMYQETVALADFTDGGSTAGTVTLGLNIPAGAIVKQAYIDAVTGFAGDTSAAATIGDGTDADRYNTGTPNVFATADHISAGAVSGTAYHAAAKDVVVTVASATDFGLVTAGQMTITVEYTQSV